MKTIGVRQAYKDDILKCQARQFNRVQVITLVFISILTYTTALFLLFTTYAYQDTGSLEERVVLAVERPCPREDLPAIPTYLPDFLISDILEVCDINGYNKQLSLESILLEQVVSQTCSQEKLLSVEEFVCTLGCDKREPELEQSMLLLNMSKYKYRMLHDLCFKDRAFSAIIYIKDNVPYFHSCKDRVQGSNLWALTQKIFVALLCTVRVPNVVFGFDNLDWAVPAAGSSNSVPGWNQPLPGVVRYVGTDTQPSVLFPTGQYLKVSTHCKLSSGLASQWIKICRYSEDPLQYSFKENKILWRGSSTGVPMRKYFLEYLPRSSFVRKFYAMDGFDVGFIGGPPPSNDKEYLEFFHKASKPFVPASEFQKYKGIMHMDGHTASWGLAQKIGFTRSLVYWIESSFTYREFFYRHLKPHKHYVPIERDFSNLIDSREFYFANQEAAEQISTQANELFQTRLRPEATYCYILRLLVSLSRHQDASALADINLGDFSVFPQFENLKI